jgi:quercetin dioxygenase-like cupin family protein
VIAGQITFVVGDQRFEAAAGDFVFAPKDVPHAYLVTSERPARAQRATPGPTRATTTSIAPARARRWAHG